MKQINPFLELEELSKKLPIIINNYKIIEKIGEGGFSRVFKVFSESYNIFFAAKVIPKILLNENCENDLFFLRGTHHPTIISIYDSFETETYLFLIFEYCLNGKIKNYFKKENHISNLRITDLFRQMIEGFAFLHSINIAHRDIKPSNILITQNNHLKIIDFGISVHHISGTLLEKYSGSYPYMAPELLRKEPHNPFLADVWSLGVTFYTLLIGELPWPRKQNKITDNLILQGIFQIPDKIDPLMSHLIHKMLMVEPNDRLSMENLLKLPLFINKFKKSPSNLNPPYFKNLLINK